MLTIILAKFDATVLRSEPGTTEYEAEVLSVPQRRSVGITVKLVERYGKAIPVRSSASPQGCEMSRIPHFPDNRLIHGGEVISLNAPAALCSQEDSWCSFLLEAKSIPGSQSGWKD
jgi:hypothetical protein